MRRLLALLCLLGGCGPIAGGDPAVWKLTPLHTGVCGIGKDHALGPEHSPDDRLPFVIYSYLAEGPRGEVVLIDLGPKSLAYTNDMFRRFGFFRDLPGRPDDVVQPHGNVFDHLKRRGIDPGRVGHVVFTHFHADHHGMDDGKNGGAAEDLPSARMNVSRTGWEWNLARRKDGRWNSYLDWAFGDFLVRKEAAGKLDRLDDGEVAPGLEVVYLGGHSVCSRAVRIRTASGWAVITSDDVYRYDLLEKGVMARLHVTPAKLVEATDRIAALGGIVLPLHEPAVWMAWQEKGDRWLEALRPLSDAAVNGYLAGRASPKARVPGKP